MSFPADGVNAQVARNGEQPGCGGCLGGIEQVRLAPHAQQGLLGQFFGHRRRRPQPQQVGLNPGGEMGKQGGKGGLVLVRRNPAQQGIQFGGFGRTGHGRLAETLKYHARRPDAGAHGSRKSRLGISQHSRFYEGTSPSDQ